VSPRAARSELRRAAQALDAIGSHKVARRFRAMARDLRGAQRGANAWELLAAKGHEGAVLALRAERAAA
jgi:hypothetical protein